MVTPLTPVTSAGQGIEGLASCTVYDRTPPELVVERVGDAELVLTNKTILNRPMLGKCLNCATSAFSPPG